MKILVDTNVILDVLCNRPEFVEASSKVWRTDSAENGAAHSADHDDL